jgi:hypothetical protein
MTAPDVEAWQIAQLEGKIREDMKRIGGTEAFPFAVTDSWNKVPENAAEAAAMLDAAAPAIIAYLSEAPLDFAYEIALRFIAVESPLPPALRRSALEALSRRFADRSGDPRRLALLLTLAELQRDDEPALRKAWRATGLPDDLCRAGAEVATMTEHHIDDDDFPRDLLRFALTGQTVFEVSVTTDGRTKDGRIILSAPSGLFDPTIAGKLTGFEMKPMQRDGRAVDCRGYTQRVLWKFPEGDSNPMPSFAEPDGPAS